MGQFLRPHDHRVADHLESSGSREFIQRREFEKIVFDTVSRRDCESRSSCLTRGLETRSFRDARRIVRIIHAARGVLYAHTRFPVFCAARWRCAGGGRGEKVERREKEREREVSCFGIKLTRGRACAVDDEWCSRVNIGAHGAERKVGRTNRS